MDGHTVRGGWMPAEHTMRAAARRELRSRLNDRLAESGLTKTQLADRSGLGRATVSEAFRSDGRLLSAKTVTALAQALGLPLPELLELQRIAADGAGAAADEGPVLGLPVEDWEPHSLEVHPAGSAANGQETGTLQDRVLPGYVHREHDRVLSAAVQEALQGRSRMVVLVGGSSTGKTRACWEAVQPLAGTGWRLWHPFDPTRAEAALEDLGRVQPRTVVWLNEAQHYLDSHSAGERIAAALVRLLTDPTRGPVLILGTLWPEYAMRYTALPVFGRADDHSQVRELLAGRTLSVPEVFDAAALKRATTLAEGGDRLLADALTRARADGRVAQDLAGAPQLLHRYEHGTAAARALLDAAMDARRLGIGLHLPQSFLTAAAADYLSDVDYDQLTDDWAEAAYAELAHLVHGKQAPLRRVNPRPERRQPQPPSEPSQLSAAPVFRLADYLEQHGRTMRRRLCPPASFWHAGHAHLVRVDDLKALATAAQRRHRLQWAHHLTCRAAHAGDADALVYLSGFRERSGQHTDAETLAVRAAQAGDMRALTLLARARERAGSTEQAEALARQAARAGDGRALLRLARVREQLGHHLGAERLYQEAAGAGNTDAMLQLMRIRSRAGDTKGVEEICWKAVKAGSEEALVHLVGIWKQDGRKEKAESLARRAAAVGKPRALVELALMLEKSGDKQRSEALARHALDLGSAAALANLAPVREAAGDHAAADDFVRQAAAAGDPNALVRLMLTREKRGDPKGAEALARYALDLSGHHTSTDLHLGGGRTAYIRSVAAAPWGVPASSVYPLLVLARERERAGDGEGAERLFQEAADAGDVEAQIWLARFRDKAGEHTTAEALARQAAAAGNPRALLYLARARERDADVAAASELFQQAVDAGSRTTLADLARLRDKADDRESADTLVLDAAHGGDVRPLRELISSREKAGDHTAATAVALRAADAGSMYALLDLARIRTAAGDRAGAHLLLRRAADAGSAHALFELALERERAADHAEAAALARQAADTGSMGSVSNSNTFRAYARRRWPHGLDPDGTPTPPWT
ncbi:helix-turn-helix domain-containing protein [Streptomyces sp. NPDC001260]|uniref:helix-turn-helix domain-containing protein n=1 Tax=Streptomyces sp. NPDC001260 TaxID=3364551 RepID=UPI00368BC6B0